jgi:hypothetical protein
MRRNRRSRTEILAEIRRTVAQHDRPGCIQDAVDARKRYSEHVHWLLDEIERLEGAQGSAGLSDSNSRPTGAGGDASDPLTDRPVLPSAEIPAEPEISDPATEAAFNDAASEVDEKTYWWMKDTA